jgi:hypothetical protein
LRQHDGFVNSKNMGGAEEAKGRNRLAFQSKKRPGEGRFL